MTLSVAVCNLRRITNRWQLPHSKEHMIRTCALRVITGATLATAAVGALAGTVHFNGGTDVWTFGSGHAVNLTYPTNQSYKGPAGGFSGSLDGNALNMYCVELTQEFWPGGTYTYTDQAASIYFTGPDNKADKLGRLLSYVFDNNLITSSAASTSLQLAIWNVVYDTDYSMSNGLFRDTSTFAAKADAWLGQSVNYADTYGVFVLSSPSSQDQLHWNKVPEPASLALVMLGLGAAGAARRRARKTG
jgi:hypothetical protein